ncbi:MAG: glycosyltransferase family 4 protein [SAR202 cluster bacterium]|nr:glycosyltransferase family 4 protein [SAR202 cluster bacterium]
MLEETVRSLGLAGRVHLPGFKSNLWGYMKSASCYVLASRYEGLPLALLEGMAAGCPVVSFDCDYGPSEILTHMENGVLVRPGDIDVMGAGIAVVLEDRSLARRMGQAGARRAMDFDSPLIARQYGALFEQMLASPESRS